MSSWWSRNRQLILQSAGTLLAILLLLLLLKEERKEGGEILAAIRQVKITDLLWVALLFTISRIAVTWRWHVLLVSGGVNIRFKDSLSLNMMGLFGNNFLPTTIGGDVVRLMGLMQLGYDRAVSLASLAADRLIGLFGMAMMAPVGVAYSWGVLQINFFTSFVAIFRKPIEFFKRIISIFSLWFRKPVSLLISLAFTWIHMLCLFGSIYIFVNGFGFHVSFWMIGGLWSLTYLITLIPISINGYGVQELAFTFLMSNVAGVTPAVGATIALLLRAYFLLSSLPGAIFLPSILSAMAKQKTVASSSESFL
jgi:glycosyltransferase 2 family protein